MKRSTISPNMFVIVIGLFLPGFLVQSAVAQKITVSATYSSSSPVVHTPLQAAYEEGYADGYEDGYGDGWYDANATRARQSRKTWNIGVGVKLGGNRHVHNRYYHPGKANKKSWKHAKKAHKKTYKHMRKADKKRYKQYRKTGKRHHPHTGKGHRVVYRVH